VADVNAPITFLSLVGFGTDVSAMNVENVSVLYRSDFISISTKRWILNAYVHMIDRRHMAPHNQSIWLDVANALEIQR
jgi:hypothetical protein